MLPARCPVICIVAGIVVQADDDFAISVNKVQVRRQIISLLQACRGHTETLNFKISVSRKAGIPQHGRGIEDIVIGRRLRRAYLYSVG